MNVKRAVAAAVLGFSVSASAETPSPRAISFFLLPLLLSGCGTICTAIDDGKGCAKLAPYSGTRAAAQGHATQLDLPFSFVADTLLLPLTIPKMLLESGSTQQPETTPRSSREQ